MRTLRRSPGFTAAAVLSIALAIALNTTVYSLLDAMLDPVVDVVRPAELYSLRYYGDRHHRLPPNAIDAELKSGLPGDKGSTGSRRLEPVNQLTLVEHEGRFRETEPLVVRWNYFSVLGSRAAAGRVFDQIDETSGRSEAVISDHLAAALFVNGESPIGARIGVGGTQTTVVGVVPRSGGLLDHDVWLLPRAGDKPVPLSMIRLADGLNPTDIDRILGVISARLAIAAGESPRDTRLVLKGLAQPQFHIGYVHYALVAAVLAVLLVACGNLANLQLARGMGRTAELAVRAAIGASRARLVWTLFLESALLAAAGLILGLLVTFWSVHLLRATIPVEVANFLVAPVVHWNMFVIAASAAIVCLILTGLLPSLSIARVDPNSLLKSAAGTGAHRRQRRRYGVMIVAQLALALPLLVGAVLVARSAWRLDQPGYFQSRIGYDPMPLVTASIEIAAPPRTNIPLQTYSAELIARARTLAGVTNAAVVSDQPAVGQAVTIETPEGAVVERPAPLWTASVVSPGYLRTFRRSMASGHDFSEGVYDRSVVIIDEGTAYYLWPRTSPVGRLIKFGDARSAAPWSRVIGVVHDPRDSAMIEIMDPSRGYHLGAVYRVMTPNDGAIADQRGAHITLYVRTTSNARHTTVALQHLLAADPSVASAYVMSSDDQFRLPAERARERFVALIFTIFALLAVGLAALGVYAIVSHSVNERRRELGVRISLGATPRDIVRTVLGEGTIVALSGMAIGLWIASDTEGWLAPFLNGIWDLSDAVLFAVVALILAFTAFFAALVPALRATKVDPVEAMRSE